MKKNKQICKESQKIKMSKSLIELPHQTHFLHKYSISIHRWVFSFWSLLHNSLRPSLCRRNSRTHCHHHQGRRNHQRGFCKNQIWTWIAYYYYSLCCSDSALVFALIIAKICHCRCSCCWDLCPTSSHPLKSLEWDRCSFRNLPCENFWYFQRNSCAAVHQGWRIAEAACGM